MARRKRKDDTPAWVAPDFDEVGFMRREIEGARAAVATIAWAVVGALVGFALYSVLPVLAFFGGIAVGFGMYFIFPLLGFKTESFKRRDWIGHGITYFFSWLAFWIILLNPPFSDHVPPTIQSISVSPYQDRKSTRLNSSHLVISYAVFCLKNKNTLRASGGRRPGHPAPHYPVRERPRAGPRPGAASGAHLRYRVGFR